MAKKTRPTEYNADEVIAAIQGTNGIQVHIARKLGVSRQTVASYIKRWKTVEEAYRQEKAEMDDIALSVVCDDIRHERNVSTAKWWVERKIPEFRPKQDLTSDDEAIGAIAFIKENRPDDS